MIYVKGIGPLGFEGSGYRYYRGLGFGVNGRGVGLLMGRITGAEGELAEAPQGKV